MFYLVCYIALAVCLFMLYVKSVKFVRKFRDDVIFNLSETVTELKSISKELHDINDKTDYFN